MSVDPDNLLPCYAVQVMREDVESSIAFTRKHMLRGGSGDNGVGALMLGSGQRAGE